MTSPDDLYDIQDQLHEKISDFALGVLLHNVFGANPDWKRVAIDRQRSLNLLMFLIVDSFDEETILQIKTAHTTLVGNFYDRYPESWVQREHEKTPKSHEN